MKRVRASKLLAAAVVASMAAGCQVAAVSGGSAGAAETAPAQAELGPDTAERNQAQSRDRLPQAVSDYEAGQVVAEGKPIPSNPGHAQYAIAEDGVAVCPVFPVMGNTKNGNGVVHFWRDARGLDYKKENDSTPVDCISSEDPLLAGGIDA